MKKLYALVGILLVLFVAVGCGKNSDLPDYSRGELWAYSENIDSSKTADVFFICPTVYMGDENSFNMAPDDETERSDFLGAVNMEKGIYDEDCRFFAPYYRQAGLNAYTLDETAREQCLELAYSDVKAAFTFYMENYNDGRPVIIAGFSQGADMSIRLLKDCFKDNDINKLLIACYAIGWRITQDELDENPHLKFAEGESDTGVIVSFNGEAENITNSLMIPENVKTLAINPLNWRTDSVPADRTMNTGACFTDYGGNILEEIPALTGAYIDEKRGALKVTDISPADYPPVLDIFEDGVYHLYDYQFFYRNIQQNVKVRIKNY